MTRADRFARSELLLTDELPEGALDPKPLFAAAKAGDVRMLAQLSLKMVEIANDRITLLAQEVIALKLENAQLKGGGGDTSPLGAPAGSSIM